MVSAANLFPMPAPSAPHPASPRARAHAGVMALAALVLLALLVGAIVWIVRTAGPAPGPARAGSAAAPGPDAAGTIAQASESASKYLNEGKPAEAGMILDRAIQKFPADQELRLKYAQALQAQQRWREAYDQFVAALRIGPELPQIHFDAGAVANMAQLTERAEHHFSMAQVKDAGEPRYPLYLAMMQIKLGKDTEAMASLLRVVRLRPDIAEAWGTMAELNLRANNLSLALQHAAEARRLQPAVLRWRIVEARATARSGQPEQALTLLAALEPAQRSEPAALSLAAECYGLLKRPADAAAMYQSAAAAQPRNPELAFQAALWHQRAGNAADARRMAQAAAALGHDKARDLLRELADPPAPPKG